MRFANTHLEQAQLVPQHNSSIAKRLVGLLGIVQNAIVLRHFGDSRQSSNYPNLIRRKLINARHLE